MAKTKALISLAVTAKLICVFVFAYAKSRFSHNAAHLIKSNKSNELKMLNILTGNNILQSKEMAERNNDYEGPIKLSLICYFFCLIFNS